MDFNLTKEQQDIVKAARKFALGEFPGRAVEFDREEKFDYAIWKKACDLGFVGIFIDEKYGGAGYGFFEHCLLNEEFWAVDPGIGSAILATTFGSEMLQMVGTEEQKQLLLPRLVSGDAIMGTAITEPDAGCDVTGAVTTAVKTGDAWVINGSKMWITNGPEAEVVIAYMKTTDPDSRAPAITAFLVEMESPGVSVVHRCQFMGLRGIANGLSATQGYFFLRVTGGYNLYRTAARPTALDTPLNAEPLASTEYLDTTVETGETYSYFVRAVLADGVDVGDRLVTSNLQYVTDGMPVRVEGRPAPDGGRVIQQSRSREPVPVNRTPARRSEASRWSSGARRTARRLPVCLS